MVVLLIWNKQSSNQVMETLNSLPQQNQNYLYITEIASLTQSRSTFVHVRKQQGRLGLYNKQYTLYKVSGIPKCVLVWIWEKRLHLAGVVGKQANEVCSKQKLSLETTQKLAIMSGSPSQSKSSAVTVWLGLLRALCPATWSEEAPMGGKAARKWRVFFLQLCCFRHS